MIQDEYDGFKIHKNFVAVTGNIFNNLDRFPTMKLACTN